ncbi:MmcQ/YjbR family DNA-binding protein [Candidatus Saccharibacteria bacterium]|nr:MmcQ/YjbR family DNA-binding protein [Candidatus Saccharibacteria bacterium]
MNSIDIYKQKQTQDIITHIIDAYNAKPEFLWKKYPRLCIFRNDRNKKWFALITQITAKQFGLNIGGDVEVLNLRFDRHEALDFTSTHENFFPAYHMNKNNWYSILLDGKLSNNTIFELIEKSYLLVNDKK